MKERGMVEPDLLTGQWVSGDCLAYLTSPEPSPALPLEFNRVTVTILLNNTFCFALATLTARAVQIRRYLS